MQYVQQVPAPDEVVGTQRESDDAHQKKYGNTDDTGMVQQCSAQTVNHVGFILLHLNHVIFA